MLLISEERGEGSKTKTQQNQVVAKTLNVWRLSTFRKNIYAEECRV
jgi:hypothetical protein